MFKAYLAGNSCGKSLRENLVGNSCGKILWEILAAKSCGKFWLKNLVGNFCGKSLAGNAVGNLVGNLVEKGLMVCNRSKNGKKTPTYAIFGTCRKFLSQLQPLKHYQTISIL